MKPKKKTSYTFSVQKDLKAKFTEASLNIKELSRPLDCLLKHTDEKTYGKKSRNFHGIYQRANVLSIYVHPPISETLYIKPGTYINTFMKWRNNCV